VTPGSGPRYRTVGMALRLHKIHRARLYTCASTDVRSQTCDGNAGLVCTGVGCYRISTLARKHFLFRVSMASWLCWLAIDNTPGGSSVAALRKLDAASLSDISGEGWQDLGEVDAIIPFLR
jgi:hypothetical protein